MIVHIESPTLADKLKIAASKGASAAYRARPYDANPYVRNTQEHLAWSVAHNGARVGEATRTYQ
jgi:hypothetical protein